MAVFWRSADRLEAWSGGALDVDRAERARRRPTRRRARAIRGYESKAASSFLRRRPAVSRRAPGLVGISMLRVADLQRAVPRMALFRSARVHDRRAGEMATSERWNALRTSIAKLRREPKEPQDPLSGATLHTHAARSRHVLDAPPYPPKPQSDRLRGTSRDAVPADLASGKISPPSIGAAPPMKYAAVMERLLPGLASLRAARPSQQQTSCRNIRVLAARVLPNLQMTNS